MSFLIEKLDPDGLEVTDSSSQKSVFAAAGIAMVALAVGIWASFTGHYKTTALSVAALFPALVVLARGVHHTTYTFDHHSAELRLLVKKPKSDVTKTYSYAEITLRRRDSEKGLQTHRHYHADLPGLSKDILIRFPVERAEEFEGFMEIFQRRRTEAREIEKETKLLEKVAGTKVPKSVASGAAPMAVPASFSTEDLKT